eukprot:g17017.t1
MKRFTRLLMLLLSLFSIAVVEAAEQGHAQGPGRILPSLVLCQAFLDRAEFLDCAAQDNGNGFRSMLPETVGTVTVWPSPLALASTWDEEAVAAQASAIGKEFRGKSANVMLGPGLNVHRTVLTVLREKMNFKGFVMSDWGAAHSTAFSAGLDMDMPGNDNFYTFQAISQASQSSVNASIRRILASMYHLRLDQGDPGCTPPLCINDLAKDVQQKADVPLARRIASQAVIMLQNNGALPLNASKVRTFEVNPRNIMTMNGLPVGDFYSGGGSGHVQGSNQSLVTTLQAIIDRAQEEKIEVLSANTSFRHNHSRPWGALQQEADLLVVVAGVKTIESKDRPNLVLDPADEELIKEASVAKPTIVLLMAPGAVLLPWRFQVSSILVLFYGGEASGFAFASVLFGDVNPALLSIRGLEEVLVDHESWASHSLQSWTLPPGSPGRLGPTADTLVSLQVRVDNVGNRSGAEVVQAYLRFPQVRGAPFQQLRGFRRTSVLPPGGHEILYLHFNRRDFSSYSQREGWRVQDCLMTLVFESNGDNFRRSFCHQSGSFCGFHVLNTPSDACATSGDKYLTNRARDRRPGAASHEHRERVKLVTTIAPPPMLRTSFAETVEQQVNSTHQFIVGRASKTPSQAKHATDENNWILWALQPSLLLLVVLVAMLSVRGSEDSDSENDSKFLPEELREAEELPRWEYAYTGVLSPVECKEAKAKRPRGRPYKFHQDEWASASISGREWRGVLLVCSDLHAMEVLLHFGKPDTWKANKHRTKGFASWALLAVPNVLARPQALRTAVEEAIDPGLWNLARKLVPDADLRGELLRSALESLGCDLWSLEHHCCLAALHMPYGIQDAELLTHQELYCKNIDDCAKLKHGCGALGLCLDLIGSYDCNCENGFFQRHMLDGEIVCGPEGIDEQICRGYTCGAYGVCIDLVGNGTGYESVKARSLDEGTFRCECRDGFFDNGTSCEHQDCGFACFKNLNSDVLKPRIWFDMSAVLLCVLSAALAAGLTLGLATLEPFGLQVILAARPEDAATTYSDHHLLLVTLLLFNTVANEALPVFLDELVPSWVALLLSVSVVLVCGEILPSAVFTGPNQFTIASALVPLVSFLELVFYCSRRPSLEWIALQDEVHEDGQKYSRAELRALLALHAPEERKQESEETPATIPAPPNSYSCDLLPKEPTEIVITTAELRMMDSVFGLQKQTLGKSRCFTVLKFCRIVNGQEKFWVQL